MRLWFAPILTLAVSCSAFGQTYSIVTLAGVRLPANIPGTSATLGSANGVAVDKAGNVFLQLSDHNVVLRLDSTTGILTRVAGNGALGFSGDNGPAASAQLGSAFGGIAVDPSGNLYIADPDNHRIRQVCHGVITTVAGTGTPGFSGDNGPAASAQLNAPQGVAVDSSGNLYIADAGNQRIRKVSNGVITTAAGNGTPGYSGDNGPATGAQFSSPLGVAVDSAGNLYIADTRNDRIREVANGIVTTVAGGGSTLGDNGPATRAQLNAPQSVAVGASGDIYIADSGNHRVRKVTGGVIATIAGNGTATLSGDGGPATSAGLDGPTGIAVASSGNVYVADSWNTRIRMLVPSGSTCTYAVNQLALTAAASGGNLPATIHTAAGCAWTVQNLPDWMALAGNSSGSGPATVYLVAAPNSGTARSAMVSIAGLSVPVSQPQSLDSPRAINPGGVVNAASYKTPVAPGSIASAFGTYAVSSVLEAGQVPLPTNLLGLSLQVANGALAPLFFVSNTQVNFQVPWELAGQSTTTMSTTVNSQTSTAQAVSLAPFAPGIFTLSATGSGAGAILDSNYHLVDSTNPAVAGSTYILIYCTGLGAVTNTPATGAPARSGSLLSSTTTTPTVTIGGVQVTPSFSGLAPGFVGLYQVNAQVPAGLAAGSAVPVTISISGQTSNTVTIPVSSVLSIDCIFAPSYSCGELALNGDPYSPTGHFTGYSDSTIRQDPNGGTVWMSYSWPAEQSDNSLGVSNHLSYYTPGAGWQYKTAIYTSRQVLNGFTGLQNYESNEVPALYAQNVNGTTYWYQVRLYYLVAPGAAGVMNQPYTARMGVAGCQAVSTSDGPSCLATATVQYLEGSGTNTTYFPISQNLTTLSDSTCQQFTEPTLWMIGTTLYMNLGCEGQITNYQFSTPDPQSNLGTWTWSYVGKFVTSADVSVCSSVFGASACSSGQNQITACEIANSIHSGPMLVCEMLSGRTILGVVAFQLATVSPPAFAYANGLPVVLARSTCSACASGEYSGPEGGPGYDPNYSGGIVYTLQIGDCVAGTPGCSTLGGVFSQLVNTGLRP